MTQNNTVKFSLPYEPYGFRDTERAVEIPWALSCLGRDEMVLDVGYAYSEQRYINELANLPLKELHGLDMVMNEKIAPNMKKTISDLRKIDCYPLGFFDSILCISTIEHVGFNNEIYFKENNFSKKMDDDLVVIQELVKILKTKGKLIITIPFGKRTDHEWFIQYDSAKLHQLISASKCYVEQLDFFIYLNDGWNNCKESSLSDISYQDNNAPAAAGLACILLRKKW